MTQVTLLKDGISVEDRVYSKGEVVTVPDARAAEMVKAGEADYAVEHNPDASQTAPGNATHPVTDQGFPIDEDGKAHPEAVIGTGQTGTLNTSKLNAPGQSVTSPTSKRENAAVPQSQPASPGTK